jgi:hypothetical protein
MRKFRLPEEQRICLIRGDSYTSVKLTAVDLWDWVDGKITGLEFSLLRGDMTR